jgi:serine protease Do
MNETIKTPKPRYWITAGALAAAVVSGYALRGTPITAQNANPNASTSTPVVQTPATTDAASMQKAFNQVSRAIEPAVVTITTERAARAAAAPGGRARPGGPGGPGADPFGGGGANPFEDFEEFFRRRFGNPGGGQGGAEENGFFVPNAAEKEQMREYFHKLQGRGGGGGLGSGMIYRADGHIITNAHVVRGATTVNVKLNDGREFKRARVLGSDERTDIAVVKIDADRLPTVRLADSANVNVGDWAIAVGNPFGLEHTMTVGVISAKAREVPLSERSPGDYLQTDASINPGNSGGPLCDIYGRVIGVNNAIYSQSGGNVGIGFAIPINTAKSIADRLVTSGRIVRGYLGVGIDTVDGEVAAGLGIDPKTRGVLIASISDPNAPGAKAGLQVGDVVTKFNGQTVTRPGELQRLVGDAAVNSTVTLDVIRDDKPLTLRATLAELKEEATSPTRSAPAPAPEREEQVAPSALGMRLRAVTPQLSQQFSLKDARGVVVVGFADNSPASKAGLQRGDVIERVGQRAVRTPQELEAAVNRILARQTGGDKFVGLYVVREGQGRYVNVPAS